MTQDKENNVYSYSYDLLPSFEFEFIVIMLYAFQVFVLFHKEKIIQSLKSNRLDVIVIKNYELKDNDSDDEEEAKPKIGINKKQKALMQQQDLIKEEKRKHQEEIKKLIKRTHRNYLDCNYFMKRNKIFFMLMIFI